MLSGPFGNVGGEAFERSRAADMVEIRRHRRHGAGDRAIVRIALQGRQPDQALRQAMQALYGVNQQARDRRAPARRRE